MSVSNKKIGISNYLIIAIIFSMLVLLLANTTAVASAVQATDKDASNSETINAASTTTSGYPAGV